MSKVSATYHIVFCTKRRELTLTQQYLPEVFRVFSSEISKRSCKLISIGGIPNHLHLLIELNSSVALSSLMRDLKAITSGWLKADGRFPIFNGWAKEYFACTLSPESRDAAKRYIENQSEHHRVQDLEEEIAWFYKRAGIEYDGRDLT